MIENFPFRCIKVLPTVYDNSLSYYEVLCKVHKKLNEVIEELNSFNVESLVNQTINARLKDYTDTVVQPLFDASIIHTDTKLEEMDEKYSACCAEIKAMVYDLNARVTALAEDLIEAEQRCKRYTDEKVAEAIQELPTLISPYSGKEVTIIEALYELYDLERDDALTASEYDAADLTATAYGVLDLTALMYDWHGKTYIH